jgi:acetylglutamate synthase
LGLGWYLPTDRIEVDTNGTGTQDDNKYFFVRNETSSRLYRNNKLWLRGVLDKSFERDLDHQNFSKALLAALLSQGIWIDASSTVAVLIAGEDWLITDPVNEFELKLVFNNGEDTGL